MDTRTHYTGDITAGQSGWHVRIAFDAVDGILQEVLRAFGAVRKRGAETGGLLLGRIEGQAVIIESFEIVPCDYRLGPSYVFPETDWERWEEALARHQGSADPHPVGFFRSDTREELTLAPEDTALIDRFVPGEEAAVLLIRPFATKVSQAAVFFRQDGSFPAAALTEFPFSRKALGGGKRAAATPAETVGELSSGPAPPDLPVEALPETPPPGAHLPGQRAESEPAPSPESDAAGRGGPAVRPVSARSAWAAAIALSAALGWSGGYFLARSLPRLPEAGVFRLGLEAQARGSEVRVSWDTASEAIKTATRGQVRVKEGAIERVIPLDLELLRQGLIVYQSPPGPVHFDLEIEQIAGSMVRESIDYRPVGDSLP